MLGALRQAGLSGFGEVIVARVELAGVQKAVRKLLEDTEGKVATKALGAVGKVGRDAVKAEIPGKYKSVRKAVAWRHVKRKYNSGQRAVKVGAGVGPDLLRKRKLTEKQQAKATQLREKAATSLKNRKQKKRPGVGIDKRNVHWWFAGTKVRYTGTKTIRRRVNGSTVNEQVGKPRDHRGKMPPQSRPIMVILAGKGGTIREVLRQHIAEGMKASAAKHK